MANIVDGLFDQVLSNLPPFDKAEADVPIRDPDFGDEGRSGFPLEGDNDSIFGEADQRKFNAAQQEIFGSISRPVPIPPIEDEVKKRIHGGIRWHGFEAIAFYKSRRFRDQSPYAGKWGIFYLNEGLSVVAHEIADYYPGFGRPMELAQEFIRQHERFHYQCDVQALQIEAVLGKPLYEPLLHAFSSAPHLQVEEALANKQAWNWAKRRGNIREFAEDFLDLQPGAYSRYRERGLELSAELASQLVEQKYAYPGKRSELAPWVGLLPSSLSRKSLCPEYVVHPANIDYWIRPALIIPVVHDVVEAKQFKKKLERRYKSMRSMWEDTVAKLIEEPSRSGMNFKPWKNGLWSVRVGQNFRAHLSRQRSGTWLAEEFGTHKEMGHG